MLLKGRRQRRCLLIAVPAAPKRRIHLEGPAGVEIKALAVPVPAIAHIIIQDGRRVLLHDPLIDRISMACEKGQVQHVEEPPVLRHGAAVPPPGEKRRDLILLRARIFLPDLLSRHLQSDHQGAGFHCLLVGAERIRLLPGCSSSDSLCMSS